MVGAVGIARDGIDGIHGLYRENGGRAGGGIRLSSVNRASTRMPPRS